MLMQSIFQSNILYYGNIFVYLYLISTILCSVLTVGLQTGMIEYC